MKKTTVFCLVAGTLALGALAQETPAPARSGTAEVQQLLHPQDPTRMPGDKPPPTLEETLRMGQRPPGGQSQGPRQPFPPDTTPAPPLALSIEAAQAAIDYCTSQGVAVGVAVVDAAGVLRVGLSADGATPPGRLFGAIPKALTAVEFKVPSSEAQKMVRADPSLAARVRPNMMVNPGAVPLMAGDRLLGAIATSGTGAQQEEACAKAGADKIKSRLK
jgi:uncharacterized protein GlcG (DUF336 family)